MGFAELCNAKGNAKAVICFGVAFLPFCCFRLLKVPLVLSFQEKNRNALTIPPISSDQCVSLCLSVSNKAHYIRKALFADRTTHIIDLLQLFGILFGSCYGERFIRT